MDGFENNSLPGAPKADLNPAPLKRSKSNSSFAAKFAKAKAKPEAAAVETTPQASKFKGNLISNLTGSLSSLPKGFSSELDKELITPNTGAGKQKKGSTGTSLTGALFGVLAKNRSPFS